MQAENKKNKEMQIRTRNTLFYLLGGLLALTSLFSCGVDRWPEYYPWTGRDLWIDSVMREDYLWYEEIPSFDDLNYFLEPQSFLDAAKSEKDNGISSVDTLLTASTPSYGFDYSLSQVPDNDTAYYAMVTYVVPESPAAEAGLKRGEWIMMVNNDYITKKNETILTEGESKDIVIGKYTVHTETGEDGTETETAEVVKDRESVLPATRPVTDAVIPASTIVQHNNSNIGYLAYNSFDTESDTQLLEFSKTCATNNVKDFVLDLRYNAGGDMESVQRLACILAPSDKLGGTLATLQYNQKKSGKNHDLIFDAQLLVGGSNLNLSTVYILTSGTTAGAAEMLINCLTPYMKVIVVGETTKGEYIGTERFENTQFMWALRLAVCEIFNARGTANYTNGFTPSYSVSPLSDPATVLPLGDPKEALLSAALGIIDGSISLDGSETTRATNAANVKEVKMKRTFPRGIIVR